MRLRAPLSSVAIAILFAMTLSAANIPLTNWTAPPTWKPTSSEGRFSIAANADLTDGMPFFAVTPCRAYDSRVGVSGDGPIPAATARTIDIDGSACGPIPAGVGAYSLNITVFGSTPAATYAFITAYPTGSTRPPVSSLNFLLGTQVSNAVIVPAGTGGDIDIYASSATEVVVDINGYYSNSFNPGRALFAQVDNQIAIWGVSGSSVGVYGVSSSSFGVIGESWGSSAVAGVLGTSGSGRGVLGLSNTYNGVWAQSENHDGLFASGGRDGGYLTGVRYGVVGNATATANDTTGVRGIVPGTSGRLYGVWGTTMSTSARAAGVLGSESGTTPLTAAYIPMPAGVRGEAINGIGVHGVSRSTAVYGTHVNSLGAFVTEGALGAPSYGVYSWGNSGASGTKSFVEPHPEDPNLVIKYVSLEGNEAGTYFRGRARTSGRYAVIDVPHDFAIVTDEEGISVQVTAIGDIAQFAVVEFDLDRIVIKSNRETEFFYTVNGIRRAYRDFNPIQRGDSEFIPRGADDRMPGHLSDEAKRRLIANGTYNADGTVNMSTAERAGWAEAWRNREAAERNRQ
jgi:hypothetical protein